jgi:hypothetical protein
MDWCPAGRQGGAVIAQHLSAVRWNIVLPPLAVVVLPVAWGRDLPVLAVAVVAVVLAAAVLAACTTARSSRSGWANRSDRWCSPSR